MQTLGEKILRLRKQAGLSQEELGNKVGVTRQAVSRWESDALRPKASAMQALSDCFCVDIRYLLGEEDAPAAAEEEARLPVPRAEGAAAPQAEDASAPHAPAQRAKARHARLWVWLAAAGVAAVIALLLFVIVVAVWIGAYPQYGDQTVSSVSFGLSARGVAILIAVVAAILLLGCVGLLVWLFKRRRKSVKNDQVDKM